MKKFFFAIAAFLMTIPSFAQLNSGGFSLDEENLYWGIRLGINFAGIGGDIKSDEGRTGMTLGGVVGLRVSDSTPLFLESGLYYTERGGNKLKGLNSIQADIADKSADGHLNYFEIPLLIKYGISTDNEISFLPFLGPYISMGISGDYNYLKHPEMGFKMGCGIEWNYLYLEAAYQFGVTNIADFHNATSHGHALAINFGINF